MSKLKRSVLVAKVAQTMMELNQKKVTVVSLQTIAVLKLGLMRTAE